jgi:tetratricopeptide (TPR) repeat protein
MQRSLEISRTLATANEVEEILKQENLYTTLQSVARGLENEKLGDWKGAVNQLREEMIRIDPWDSTGHSELALFWARQSDWLRALPHFQAAVTLGPPGIALNEYFLGFALKKMGEIKPAKNHFENAARLDQRAISPRMELIEIYSALGLTKELKESIGEIVGSSPLSRQLTVTEGQRIGELRGVIG